MKKKHRKHMMLIAYSLMIYPVIAMASYSNFGTCQGGSVVAAIDVKVNKKK